jgi:hypothetical protein
MESRPVTANGVHSSNLLKIVGEALSAEALILPNRLRSPKICREGLVGFMKAKSEKVGRGRPGIPV